MNQISISGATHAQSRQNLCQWMDNLVVSYSHADCLYIDASSNRVHGAYHKLQQQEHSKVEGKLSQFVTWAAECEAAGYSAGRYLSIEGAGRGACEFVTRKFGPFVTY